MTRPKGEFLRVESVWKTPSIVRWRSSSRCDRCRRGERGLGGRGVSRSTITRRLKRSAKPAARPSRFCTVRRSGPAGAESPSADPGVRHAAHAPSGVDVDQSVRRSARRARRPRLNRSPWPPTPDAPAPVRHRGAPTCAARSRSGRLFEDLAGTRARQSKTGPACAAQGRAAVFVVPPRAPSSRNTRGVGVPASFGLQLACELARRPEACSPLPAPAVARRARRPFARLGA